MNYLFIIDSLGSGGAERQIVALATSTKQKNHNVVILAHAKGDHFLKTILDQSIDYFLIEEDNPLKRILKFRKKIRQLKPDYVIAFLRTSSILAELSLFPFKRFKLIIQECNNIYLKYSIKNALFLQFHRFADIVTTNSESTTSSVLKRAPYLKSKMRTIYNGLDLNRFKPPEQYTPNEKRVFVVFSSHQPHKNARNLILALNEIRNARKDLCPIVYWYGSDFSEYVGKPTDAYLEAKKLIAELNLQDNFILKSPIHDVENVHKKADALIQCSFWEGLPNAVCEGMASGLPILMSNVSDYQILTKGNGQSFNPYSVDEIVKSINWFCDLNTDEIAIMRRVSREKAENLFAMEKMVDSFLNLT